ncbi:phosphotransferase [Kribbella speibonae]|uniref:Aminoglycoside phosphotransferase domain-containing protein n=1 Tax=Kribbella speibonae TaxID=1572660 RepID=A0ABY2ABH0_9ACTN|nr:phosphotransferase [Kribbella speibonae]TCC26600.1 hypothetical protein E0H58_00745 [Kribbella speibonae]
MALTEHGRPTQELHTLIASALGKEPIDWHRPHTGRSAESFVVGFADGSGAFVKTAAEGLRTEHEIVSSVDSDLVPRELAWIEDGDRQVLVMEDLRTAHWPADHDPVTWKPGQFELLFAALRRVGELPAPASLPSAQDAFRPHWPLIEQEADAFLALGLCSEAWFSAALAGLVEAEGNVPVAGDALVHNDVRSDNLCFVDRRVVLVDWAQAVRGNPQQDLALALSTLPLEGGPDPYGVFPDGGLWAAHIAGQCVRRAVHETQAPEWLRTVFQRIAVICLSWASRSLDLPPWTGRHWSEISTEAPKR